MSARKRFFPNPIHLALTLSLGMVPYAAGADSIKKVTLSTAGLADIVRIVEVPEQGPVQLRVPLHQVNDVLKTLMLSDGKNQLSTMTLAGQAALDNSFANLPFSAQSLRSLPELAAQLRGVPVRVYTRGKELEGIVLGVDIQHSETQESAVLSLLGSAGNIDAIALDNNSKLQVLDPQIQEQLQAASVLLADQTNENSRDIQLHLKQRTSDQLELSYLIAAPVWKSTYRLLLNKDQARLQAWAILENTTGQDWKQVQLSLSSGNPVLYQQELLQQYWNDRPYLPIAVGSTSAPQADTQQILHDVNAAAGRLEMQAMAPRPRSLSAAKRYETPELDAAQSQESATQVLFELADPVSVPQGQTVVVPLLDQALQAERVAVYQMGQASPHPTAAIYLNNSLGNSLPPGIMTVFDSQSGHVGDAELAGLPAGESRLIYFARDNKIQISEQSQESRELNQTKLAEGLAQTRWTIKQSITYTIKGASDQDSVVILDIPKRAGWEFSSQAEQAESTANYRLRVPVKAGQTQQVQAVFSHLQAQSIKLDEIDVNTLELWSQAELSPALQQALPELIRLRQQEQAALQTLRDVQERLDNHVKEQQRIRENLGAVNDQSSLGQRFTDQLATQEDQILQTRTEEGEQRKQWQEARAQFQAALAKL